MKIYIEKVRLEKGLSLSELARKSGVSKSHISNIESELKYPTLPTLCKIANALGVPASELFSCDNERS